MRKNQAAKQPKDKSAQLFRLSLKNRIFFYDIVYSKHHKMSRHPRTAICIRKDKASFKASQLHLSDSTTYVQPQSNYFALKNRSYFFNDRSRSLCVSDRRAPQLACSLGSCGRSLGRHGRPDDGAVNAPRLQWAGYPLQTLRISLRCLRLCRGCASQ